MPRLSHDSAQEPHHRALDQELRHALPASRAQRSSQADLAHPLEHRDEGDVRDAERADKQRHATEQQKEAFRSFSTPARSVLGSGGRPPAAARVGRTRRLRRLAGDDLDGADVGLRTEAGAASPNSRRAVPFGMATGPISASWRSALATRPLT